MKRLLFTLSIICFLTNLLNAQSTVQIGTDSLVPGNTLYAPIYRFSASTTTDFARSNILYTATELNAVGIFSGSTISKIAFYKNGIGATTGNTNFAIWMNNSSTTPPLSTTTTWASISSAYTQVYSTATQTIPATTGWIEFTLTTPFVYTGGSLEIAFDFDCFSISGNPTTAEFDWQYTSGYSTYIIGASGTSTAPATLNGTVAAYKERPNIQITFQAATGLDAGLGAVGLTVCSGITPIVVNLQNAAATTIDSAVINWSVNGVAQTSYLWTGSIPQGNSSNVTIGSYNFANGISYDIQAIITSVNGLGLDLSQGNDTLNINGFQTALSGIFTIDSLLVTSGTNFQNFTDFISALTNFGVCGPVVANVAVNSGPYEEQVIIPQINGASSVNTITINGNGELLRFNSANTNERAVIKLNGADHITIDSLSISAQGTYGFGIQLLNDADSNTISNCTLDILNSSTSTNYAGIAISNSATSATGTGNTNCDYNTISNNSIAGGYYGITLVANGATNMIYGNRVIGNDVKDFYQYGIYVNGNDGTLIESNDISRPTRATVTSFYGVYHTSVSQNVVVSRNRIHNPFGGNTASTSGAYGVYHTNTDATLGNENLIVNNLIYDFNGAGTHNGFLTGGSDYTRYYHNTISLDDNTATCPSCATRGFYLQTSAAIGLELVNNIFTIMRTGGGESQGLYFAVAGSSFISDYNDIYVASSGSVNQVGYINGAGQLTLNDWISASMGDSNSVVQNPLYTNTGAGNFSPSSVSINNTGAPLGVLVDITGSPRDLLTPDIGAYEFDVSGTDAGVAAITTQSCPGTDSVLVTVQNFGTSTINSIVVYATVDGVPTPNSGSTFAVNIPASSTAIVNLGATAFSVGSTYSIVAFTSLPNGQVDTNNPNDTLTTSIALALTGTYTINATVSTGGTNFQSFSDAATALNTYGVCGPVIINVVPGFGPYVEQIAFNQISGSSSVNTITINGNGETLTFNPTSTLKYVLRLNGTDYMTIDSLKIVGSDPTYGYGILLSTNADYNVIRNCEIDLSAITSTSTTNSCGICASASPTSPVLGGSNANFNQILSNTIKGGSSGGPYYGITLYGNTGAVGCNANIISGNDITDFYHTGIRLNLSSACEIIGNDISRPAISSAGVLEGIYVTGATNPKTKILKNRVHNSHGGNGASTATVYPIDISSDGGGLTQEILVANNLIYDINHNGPVYALYVSSSLYSNFYHNSVSLDHLTATGTTTSRGIYLLGTCDSINIKNNIISITRSGTGVMYGLYYSSIQSSNASDHNSVYVNTSTGAGFFGYNGTAQLTLADWISTSLRDSSSLSINPLFTAAVTGNLTPSAAAINDMGENLTSVVPDDILGNTRTATPDPGAFEFTPAGEDAGATVITSSICAGTDSVYVTAQNFGSSTVSSLQVTLTSNGVPSSLSGSVFGLTLAPGEDTTLNLGTLTFVAGNSYSLVAYTSQPNGIADANNANDSTSISVNLGLSGSYTINSAIATGGTNFQSFTDAANDLNSFGICGPVVINVVPGSGPYSNQQIVINELNGSSAVNTVNIKGNNEVFTFLSTNGNNRAGIRLNGADYLTIDSLIIIAEGDTSTEYGFGIQLMNGADNNTISNNQIYLDTSTSSTNYAGIAFSNSVTSAITAGNNGNGNTVKNNRVTGGYYGISLLGISSSIHANSNRVMNNLLDGFYYYGIYAYYQDTSLIEGNSIMQRSGGSATCYGINQSTNYWTSVRKNTIVTRGSSTNYGIYCVNCLGDANLPVEWTNNMITCLNGTGTAYGIYPLNNGYLNIYHNSINMEAGSATAGRGLYLNATTAGLGNVRVLNNIIVNTGLGYAVEVSSGAVTNSYLSAVNYNNIYGTGAVLARYNNLNETTLAGWIATSGLDSNSLSINPQFVSATDLHVTSAFMNDRATLGTGIADDIDGDVRCPNVGCAGSTLRPDIGADEFFGTPITVDIGVNALASPTQTSCYTNSESVVIQVKNFNTQLIDFSLNPVTVYTSVTGPNGTAFAPIVLNTGSLGSDSILNVTFATNYDMSVPGAYSFTFYTSEPSDANPVNDTISNVTVTFIVGTIANTFAEVCSGSAFELKMDGITGPLQWQSYDNLNSIWVNETGSGFDSVAYSVSPSTTTLYRALVCTSYPSATDTLVPIFVAAPTVNNDTVCSGQTAQLIAAGTGSKNWYSAIAGGSPFYTGDTLSLTANADTTLYVEASSSLAGGLGALKITEIDVDGTTDKIEIQNLSGQTLNTAGWVVAVSNSYTVINTVNATLWNLPATIAPGQVLYKTDATANNYWGSNILWNPSQQGWAMIIDNNGVIRDLVVMDWPASALPTFSAVINGFNMSFGPNDWTGNGVDVTAIPTGTSINRIGNSDNEDASDFVRASLTIGTQNAGLSSAFQGGACSSVRVPATIKVEDSPIVNLGADTTQCEGTVTLDAANTGNTYLWSTTDATQTITVSTSGVYAVTVTSPNGCVSSDAINVNIAPYPVANLGNDTSLCGGAIILSTSNLGNTFAWSTGSSSPFITVASSGIYSVTVTTPVGCSRRDTVSVTVNPAASVTLIDDTAQCGGTVTLDAANTGNTYLWSNGANTQTISVSQSGNYSVVVTDANSCTATDSVNVAINSFPSVSLGADTVQCGGNVVLDAGNIGSSYLWSNAASSQSVVVSSSGTYSVLVTNTNGCTSSDTVDVTINANPTLNFNAVDTLCVDASAVTLSASPSGGTFSGIGVTGNSFSPATAGVGTKTITYSYTDNNGCSATATDNIEVVVCVGIAATENDILFTVYPNPSSGIVQVAFTTASVQKADIEIFGIDGRLTRVMDNVQNNDVINLSEVAAGIYTFRITTANNSVVKRVTIE